MFNLIKEQDSDNLINKIYLYFKDLNEPKYPFLIEKHENGGIKHLNDLKAFIEYSQCMNHVYDNIDYCNLNRKRKILVVFDDMIVDIMTKKKISSHN